MTWKCGITIISLSAIRITFTLHPFNRRRWGRRPQTPTLNQRPAPRFSFFFTPQLCSPSASAAATRTTSLSKAARHRWTATWRRATTAWWTTARAATASSTRTARSSASTQEPGETSGSWTLVGHWSSTRQWIPSTRWRKKTQKSNCLSGYPVTLLVPSTLNSETCGACAACLQKGRCYDPVSNADKATFLYLKKMEKIIGTIQEMRCSFIWWNLVKQALLSVFCIVFCVNKMLFVCAYGWVRL